MTDEQRLHLEDLGAQLATARQYTDQATRLAKATAREYHALGVPRADMARALGVSRQTVTTWTS